jgi:hypothetical protein
MLSMLLVLLLSIIYSFRLQCQNVIELWSLNARMKCTYLHTKNVLIEEEMEPDHPDHNLRGTTV